MYKLSRHPSFQFSSVQWLSHVWLFGNPWTVACQASLSITNSQACSNSCPSSWWCHPTISSSIISFSSCLQSFPVSESFPVTQLCSSHQVTKVLELQPQHQSLQMNIQNWFLLGLTGLISLHSKGISRVFSNNTVQKNQFLSIHPSLWSSSHIHTWLLEKP